MSLPGGRALPDPGFAGDDGAPHPALHEALAQLAYGGPAEAVLAALTTARLLVPVVAILESADAAVPEHLAAEKDSSMAAVTLTGRDGRRALLAFTGVDAMARWDPGARPVAVTSREAAAAAIDQRADALLIDVAGPVSYALQDSALRAAAAGYAVVRQGDGSYAWVVPVSRRPAR